MSSSTYFTISGLVFLGLLIVIGTLCSDEDLRTPGLLTGLGVGGFVLSFFWPLFLVVASIALPCYGIVLFGGKVVRPRVHGFLKRRNIV